MLRLARFVMTTVFVIEMMRAQGIKRPGELRDTIEAVSVVLNYVSVSINMLFRSIFDLFVDLFELQETTKAAGEFLKSVSDSFADVMVQLFGPLERLIINAFGCILTRMLNESIIGVVLYVIVCLNDMESPADEDDGVDDEDGTAAETARHPNRKDNILHGDENIDVTMPSCSHE